MIYKKRDGEMLMWVNGFGCVTAGQVVEWMGVSNATGYVRVKKLVEGGYLERRKILHKEARVHWITKQAEQVIGDDLIRLRNVSLGTYFHDLLLVDLSLFLEKKTGYQFVPERRLRIENDGFVIGKNGRIPDGVLITEDKPIAIELELSVKGKRRLSNILNNYMMNFEYSEVWYFTNNQYVFNAITKLLPKNSNIKINFFNSNKEI
jgi:hypothetical protein